LQFQVTDPPDENNNLELHYGFRKKAALLAPFKADLIIVPECEQPEKLLFEEGTPKPTNLEWFGTNPHKGLGIFSYGNYKETV
jgi:exodeoxyribonuclease-3